MDRLEPGTVFADDPSCCSTAVRENGSKVDSGRSCLEPFSRMVLHQKINP